MMMKKPFLSEEVISSAFRSLCSFSFWEEGVATVFFFHWMQMKQMKQLDLYIYMPLRRAFGSGI